MFFQKGFWKDFDKNQNGAKVMKRMMKRRFWLVQIKIEFNQKGMLQSKYNGKLTKGIEHEKGYGLNQNSIKNRLI